MSAAPRLAEPYKAFERDIPATSQEDVMTMIAESAHLDGAHDCIQILDRDVIDAINVRAHGILQFAGEEYTFQVEDGNWNGTVILSWNEDREFVHHTPTVWTLQPKKHLIDDAVMSGRGRFLLAKWDAFMARRDIADIPAKYSYDRRVRPGGKVEGYWRDKAAFFQLDIVSKETADETRAILAKARGAA